MKEFHKGGTMARPKGILIVDDTKANLLAFSALLRPLCSRIVVAGSGREALKIVEAEDFDIFLMDVRMPDLNGIETAELLRKSQRARQIPILFISAYDVPPLHLFSQFVGGNLDFLQGPVDGDILTHKVESMLQPDAEEATADPSDPNLEKSPFGVPLPPDPGAPGLMP